MGLAGAAKGIGRQAGMFTDMAVVAGGELGRRKKKRRLKDIGKKYLKGKLSAEEEAELEYNKDKDLGITALREEGPLEEDAPEPEPYTIPGVTERKLTEDQEKERGEIAKSAGEKFRSSMLAEEPDLAETPLYIEEREEYKDKPQREYTETQTERTRGLMPGEIKGQTADIAGKEKSNIKADLDLEMAKIEKDLIAKYGAKEVEAKLAGMRQTRLSQAAGDVRAEKELDFKTGPEFKHQRQIDYARLKLGYKQLENALEKEKNYEARNKLSEAKLALSRMREIQKERNLLNPGERSQIIESETEGGIPEWVPIIGGWGDKDIEIMSDQEAELASSYMAEARNAARAMAEYRKLTGGELDPDIEGMRQSTLRETSDLMEKLKKYSKETKRPVDTSLPVVPQQGYREPETEKTTITETEEPMFPEGAPPLDDEPMESDGPMEDGVLADPAKYPDTRVEVDGVKWYSNGKTWERY